MDPRKSFHSVFTVKHSKELKDIILPQINYVKSHKLLARSATDSLMATCIGFPSTLKKQRYRPHLYHPIDQRMPPT